MNRLLAIAALVGSFLVARPARAGTEWVLILDNSASMSIGSKVIGPTGGVEELPPNDPDRLSVLATLIFRALLDGGDRLTLLTFQSAGGTGRYQEVSNTEAAVRALRFDQSTPFSGPLRRAREVLLASRLASRALLLVTDGAPSEDDPLTPERARALLGLDAGPQTFDVLSLGLTGGHKLIADAQQRFLAPLGKLSQIESARGLVTAFTNVFAAQIRSRPQSGRLESGQTFSFPVGRYVTEVLVDMASEGRTGPFEATLTADGESIAPTGEAGDNGCAAPPCHAYRVIKTPHDPSSEARYSLRLVRSSGPVAYGVILRYDLAAEIVRAPATAPVGEEIEVAARLVWRGHTFDDRAFFAADGFEAELELGGAKVPLERRDDGTFIARIKVGEMGILPLRARFSNRWLDLAATADFKAEGWLPLALKVSPSPLDLGSIRGERTPVRRCGTLDFAGSENHRRVPLEIVAEGLPAGVTLEPASPLALEADGARVCVVVKGCCGDLSAPQGAHLVVRGRDPHYHAQGVAVPLRLSATRTPFLVCWWRVIAGAAGAALLVFLIVGFVRPNDFGPDDVIRLAKTESSLARANGRRLRELPGGRRGFYRDARVAFDASGNTVRSPGEALIVIRARRADALVTVRGGVEMKDLHTLKWQHVADADTVRKGIVYRAGGICFRLG